VTIFIDQYFLEDIVTMITAGMLDVSIARFILYPFVLVLGAAVPVGGKQPEPTRGRFVFSNW
jgi:hypothetical protein